MLIRRKLMRTSRTLFWILRVVALATFAYSVGGAAAGDSMSGKWLSPAASGAKKNPIAPTHDPIAAGQKIYLKTCELFSSRAKTIQQCAHKRWRPERRLFFSRANLMKNFLPESKRQSL